VRWCRPPGDAGGVRCDPPVVRPAHGLSCGQPLPCRAAITRFCCLFPSSGLTQRLLARLRRAGCHDARGPLQGAATHARLTVQAPRVAQRLTVCWAAGAEPPGAPLQPHRPQHPHQLHQGQPGLSGAQCKGAVCSCPAWVGVRACSAGASRVCASSGPPDASIMAASHGQ